MSNSYADFSGRENAGKKGGNMEEAGNQDGQDLDEVSELWGGTQINRNGFI